MMRHKGQVGTAAGSSHRRCWHGQRVISREKRGPK